MNASALPRLTDRPAILSMQRSQKKARPAHAHVRGQYGEVLRVAAIVDGPSRNMLATASLARSASPNVHQYLADAVFIPLVLMGGIHRPGQYSNALKVLAFNTAEGWSWDVSVDIAREVLQGAVDAGENPGEDTERFIDPHVADPGECRSKNSDKPGGPGRRPQARFREVAGSAISWAGAKGSRRA
jgi:hypothetical protein